MDITSVSILFVVNYIVPANRRHSFRVYLTDDIKEIDHWQRTGPLRHLRGQALATLVLIIDVGIDDCSAG